VKRCCTCRRDLPADQFYRCAKRADGLQAQCKQCNLHAVRKYQKKRGKSNVHRSIRYGLTFDEVATFLAIPSCQCCDRPFASEKEIKFDHCHDGGHVRGVICHQCNIACHGSALEAVMRMDRCRQYLLRDLERQLEQDRAG
jgi:hypothetical protein